MIMSCCVNDLRDKDVVNINDGRKLGCVTDVDIDICSGRLVAIMVPGATRGFFFGRCEEIRIPWEKIVRIGNDTILVDLGVRSCEQGKGDKRKNM